jgi:hypothetical protein
MRFVSLLAGLALAACGGGGPATGSNPFGLVSGGGTNVGTPPPPPIFGLHTVVYVVTGTGTDSVDLTYRAADGSTPQQTGASLPVSIQVGNVPAGRFLYIAAQNNNDSGTITATIMVDGAPFRSETSTGEFVIATATGTCC